MSSIYQQHTSKSEGGGMLYLRIEDGETRKLRIASEPVIFESEYLDKISTRYAWLVWDVENNTPHVFSQSATFYRSIANLAADEDYGDPQNYDIKVTRQGTGTDTTYSVVPGTKRYELPAEAGEQLEKLDLVELVNKGKGVQRVQWLTDFISGSEQTPKDAYAQSGYEKAKAKAAEIKAKKDDVVFEDIGDEPVNLDDIPF